MSFLPFLPMVGILHVVGSMLFMLGLLALIGWAWKSWKPQDYKKAAMWLIGAGVILCAISLGARVGMSDWDGYGPMMKGGQFFKSFDCIYDKK